MDGWILPLFWILLRSCFRARAAEFNETSELKRLVFFFFVHQLIAAGTTVTTASLSNKRRQKKEQMADWL